MDTMLEHLGEVQKFLSEQRYIRAVSLGARDYKCLTTIAYDAGNVSEGDAEERMQNLGIKDFRTESDWKSNLTLVRIPNLHEQLNRKNTALSHKTEVNKVVQEQPQTQKQVNKKNRGLKM
jgi:hypothetical protein